jgi:hypothetical protein
MSKKLLLTAHRTCPGPMSALRNIKAVLEDKMDIDVFAIEDLVFPIKGPNKVIQRQLGRVQNRLKMITLERLLPYGDNIIFAGFGPLTSRVLTGLSKKGIQPSVMWCSTLNQAEITHGEVEMLTILINLLNSGKIKHLMAHRRIFESYGYFLKQAVFFPHPIDLKIFDAAKKQKLDGINLDLFCSPRLGKNILTQALACKISGLDVNLHINFDIGRYKQIIQSIGQKIVVHSWLPKNEYYGLISGMDMSLQVTFGESFNYAVAERMALSVPVLTTFDIYMVADDPFLNQYLCVNAIDTPKVIGASIKRILSDKKLRDELAKICRERIEQISLKNNQIVCDTLLSLFG